MIIVYTLPALALLRAAVILAAALLLIAPVSACPACFQPSLPIRRAWLAPFASRFEWRWCPHCGWQGPARRVRG